MDGRRERTIVRRRVALIGIAAILFQALLFGWHHHAIAVPASSAASASVTAATAPLAPAAAEDLCEICTILHQQTGASITVFLLPMPSPRAVAKDLTVPVLIGRADSRGFNARAPPRA